MDIQGQSRRTSGHCAALVDQNKLSAQRNLTTTNCAESCSHDACAANTHRAMADLRVQEAQQTHEQRLREAKSEAKRREIQQQLHAAQQAQQMAAEVAAAKRKQKYAVTMSKLTRLSG